MRPVIEEMQAQEKEHLDVMERLCAKHNVQPTILAPLFSIAAYTLGFFHFSFNYLFESFKFNYLSLD